MDKKIAGLVGAISALVPLGAVTAPATAAPDGALTANSYADLLKPIPNAVEQLKASDAVLKQENAAKVEMAQYYYHHHHHHHFLRRFFHPYYHHHHHWYHHHHWHHHHHHFY